MTLYATKFDSKYLLRGATCIRSIVERSKEPIRFLVLALDEACAENLPRLLPEFAEQIEILSLASVERDNPELLKVKPNRSKAEYIFTTTPILCLAAIKRVEAGDIAVYFDADTYFFRDGALALAEMGDNNVAVTEHRFSPENARLLMHGRFNMGWLAFRNGADTLKCFERWRLQCLENCSLVPSEKVFGDQKYLDEWPKTLKKLVIIDHPGVNTAPWNAMNYKFSGSSSAPMVEGRPLIVFHFHNLRKLDKEIYEAFYESYGVIPPSVLPAYANYLQALEATEQRAQLFGIPVEPLAFRPDHSFLGRLGRRWRALGFFRAGKRIVFKEGKALSVWKGLSQIQ